ncbi:hypothetical protein M1293_02820 [Candidatus Parvarchaeota archaeon]|nr:hypothetical protein [Candidatus Parvarchaeota archaeon]
MSITGNGLHHRSRRRLKRRKQEKGSIDIRKEMQTFSPGDTVVVSPSPYRQRNIPHRSFFGLNGKIIEKRGRAYVVEINKGSSKRRIDLMPVHLEKLN